jgi:hypothetical protein
VLPRGRAVARRVCRGGLAAARGGRHMVRVSAATAGAVKQPSSCFVICHPIARSIFVK